MQGTGANIGKALRAFCRATIGCCLGAEDELHWQLWSNRTYPKTLKALMKLPDFRGSERMADAYICGYRRGLCDAQALLEKQHIGRLAKYRKEGKK